MPHKPKGDPEGVSHHAELVHSQQLPSQCLTSNPPGACSESYSWNRVGEYGKTYGCTRLIRERERVFADDLPSCHRTTSRAKYPKGERIVIAWHRWKLSKEFRGVLT